MAHIVRPDLASAQAVCDQIDKMLGIPPEGLPGIGGDGRTMTWAKPVQLEDGTYGVPVPEKGLLKGLVERLRENPKSVEDALTKDVKDKDNKVVQPKRVTKAVFDAVTTDMLSPDTTKKQKIDVAAEPKKAAKKSSKKAKEEVVEEGDPALDEIP